MFWVRYGCIDVFGVPSDCNWCALTSASWESGVGTAFEREVIELDVGTNGYCGGRTIDFEIFEGGSSVDSLSGVVGGGSVSVDWLVEASALGYTFDASYTGWSSIGLSGVLTVLSDDVLPDVGYDVSTGVVGNSIFAFRLLITPIEWL